MEIVLRQHVLQRASTHIASSGSIDFSHFETAAGHHSRTAYLLGGSRWSRRGAYLRTDIRIVEDVVVTSHPLANHVRKGSGLKDHAGRASRTITAIVKQVLPQRHLVVQGTRALRAAGAFTGRTDLNVTKWYAGKSRQALLAGDADKKGGTPKLWRWGYKERTPASRPGFASFLFLEGGKNWPCHGRSPPF